MRAFGLSDFWMNFVNTLTAIVSVFTAVVMPFVVPKLIRSIDETIRDLKRLNEELEKSKEKTLMTFMSFLCHEMRNPLFVITSNLSFMEDDAHDPQQQAESLHAIQLSTDVMLRLVNDVLDISKLEAGKLDVESAEFELRKTMEGAASSFSKDVQERHQAQVEFHSYVAPQIPTHAWGDSTRLLQCVYNLLSNANKFTDQGHIHLSATVVDSFEDFKEHGSLLKVSEETVPSDIESAVDVQPAEKHLEVTVGCLELSINEKCNESKALLSAVNKGSPSKTNSQQVIVQIQVRDTGSGIPPDQLKSIFEPYTQSKLAIYRKHGGTGLGLSVVAKLVEAMKGCIKVESQVGKGSVFTIQVPLHLSSLHQSGVYVTPRGAKNTLRANDMFCLSNLLKDNSLSAPLQLPPLKSSVEKEKLFRFPAGRGVVLIVDDNEMNRKILKRMLQKFGLAFLEAKDGAEAVQIVMDSANIKGTGNSDYELGLVLMDISMPVMDGYEATRNIRSHSQTEELPIVVLTAAAIDEGSHKAIECGATEYQTKPIKRDELLAVCRRYLSPE